MSRFARILYGCISAAFAVGLLASFRTIAERAADKVYPDLQTFYDTEAPPTAASYPASSSITAVLGGRGEGLSCSIPSPLQWAMFDRAQGDATISLQFRQACAYHDYCYRHGHATYGYTRNDCDYSLQQIAYRTCRLISDMDPKDCMSRARRILLGVTIGGGKSFATHEQSSYFEFDPMPTKADDYVTVRWVKDGNGTSIGRRKLNGQFVVMHYKRGTVVSRAANFDPAGTDNSQPDSNTPQLFPSRFIATPPFVIRDGREDRLWAVARDNFQNTQIKVVEYWPAVDGQRKNKIVLLRLYEPAPDASVYWFSRARTDELSYWSYTAGFGTANKTSPNPIHFKPLIHSNYRTLQHTPVEGRFFDTGCVDTAVMKRGGPQTSDHDDDGEDYDGIVHLTFVRPPASPCTGHAPVTLAAAQTNEPLAVVRLDTGRDVLLAVHRYNDSVKLSVFDLAKANGTNPLPAAAIELPAQLDHTWLMMPPQVLFDAGSKSSILFFSRFAPSAPQAGVENAQFAFKYFKLAAGAGEALNVTPAGSGTCTIDLSSQLQAVRHKTLGTNIARSFRVTKKNEAQIEGRIQAAILGNLNERWANAQLIPGWFLQKYGVESDTGPLDVAVFFRGLTQYSFLAQGRTSTTDERQAGFQSVAPSYVQCR